MKCAQEICGGGVAGDQVREAPGEENRQLGMY